MKPKSHRIATVALTVLAGLLATAAWAGWPHHTTRPAPQRGIPNRDYDYPRFSDPALALSRPEDSLTESKASTEPAARPAGEAAREASGKTLERKLFQLDRPRVRVDHCAVWRFSLVIDEKGNWLLSGAGQQGLVDQPAAGDVMTGRQLAVLPQRNQFRLCVRGYPATAAAGDSPGGDLGRPMLFELPVQIFWVQRNTTRSIRATGNSTDVKNGFLLVERIELEFAYR